MSAITLQVAQARLTLYLEAEAAVLGGQSYKIGDRELRRADLQEIQRGIKAWEQRVTEQQNAVANGGRGRSRTIRVAA